MQLNILDWHGSVAPYLDTPAVTACGDMLLGCYGGHTQAGATKNEDAAFLCVAPNQDWHLAVLCDAHVTSQSADLVIATLAHHLPDLAAILAQPIATALPQLQHHILTLFTAADFRRQCQAISGESSCLIGVQKEQFVWWLSVGDCALYLLHPELARLGQYQLNQRHFYEWIGQVNSLALALPCFTTGVRELRPGVNHLLMTTDGLLEAGTRPFASAQALYDLLVTQAELAADTAVQRIEHALARVHAERGRDSATLIYWVYDNPCPSAYPTG